MDGPLYFNESGIGNLSKSTNQPRFIAYPNLVAQSNGVAGQASFSGGDLEPDESRLAPNRGQDRGVQAKRRHESSTVRLIQESVIVIHPLVCQVLIFFLQFLVQFREIRI